jgi:hypothetical protein
MPAPQHEPRSHKAASAPHAADTPSGERPSGVTVTELLASCAAASAVSTPPATEGPETQQERSAPAGAHRA